MHLVSAGLHGPGHYISIGPLTASVGNLVEVSLMIGLFVLALIVPFPGGKND